MPEAAFDFDQEHSVMKLFIDNAKNYVHLSGAALVLSVSFMREIVGTNKIIPDFWMITAWIAFLLAGC